MKSIVLIAAAVFFFASAYSPDSVGGPIKPKIGYTNTCGGECTGTAFVYNVNGGQPPYSYLWSNGATTATITGLCEGLYKVTVTDASNSPGKVLNTYVNAFTQLMVTSTSTNSLCSCTGSATVTPSKGKSPYTYLWSNNKTTATVTGLCAGSYHVTVTDANGCTAGASVTITGPQIVLTAVAGVAVDSFCINTCRGYVTTGVSGGAAPYAYLWSNGRTTSSLTDVCSGVYSVTVTDAAGCTASASATVTAPQPLSVSLFDISPSGDICNGFINSTPSGGTTPYFYHWSNNATTKNIGGLCAGAYSLTVTDAAGCTVVASATLTTPYYVQATGTNPLCFAGYTGTVTATINYGTPPYSYFWSFGATTSTASGLPAGNYSVTVTDANGLTTSDNVTLTQPARLIVSGEATDAGVDCSGTVTASATGGTPPYLFVIDADTFFTTRPNMCYGLYMLTVVDAHGCTASDGVFVPGGNQFNVFFSGYDASCADTCNGSLTAIGYGGTAPYSYLWNNGATTATQTGLCAGTYTVIVTDATGATVFGDNDVLEPNPLEIFYVTNDADCNVCNGFIVIEVNGGTTYEGYYYLWSDGSTQQNLISLCPGTYGLTVEDGQGCTASLNIPVGSTCRLDVESNVNETEVYPNPSGGPVRVTFAGDAESVYTLRLHDVTGKLLQQSNGVVKTGRNTADIDLSFYADGIYLLQLIKDNDVQTFRLVKR